MKKSNFYDLIKFIAFILCFVGIPVWMVWLGYNYTSHQNRKVFENNLYHEIGAFFTKLEFFEDQQKFWFFLFNSEINNKSKIGSNISETINNIVNNFKELRKTYDFEYIVYNPNYGIASNIASSTLGGDIDDLNMAMRSLFKYKLTSSENLNIDEQINLGKVFGPQFFVDHLNISETSNKGVLLCWTDSQYKRSLIWNSFINGCLSMAFLKPKYLTDLNCIKDYLASIKNEIRFDFGFVIENTDSKSFLYSDVNVNRIEEIEKASLIYKQDNILEIKTDNYYVYPKFLRPGVVVYAYYEKSKLLNIKPSFSWKIVILVVLSIGVLLIRYGWRIIFLHKIDKLSIKWKLAFLFFFANGLPLLVLIFIGNDFLKQAKSDFIQKKITEGTAFLQDFDDKYELEFVKSIISKEKIKQNIIKKKKNLSIDKKDLDELYFGISQDTWALFVVASQGSTLIRNSDGIFDHNDLKRNPDGKYKGAERYINSKEAQRFDKYLSDQMEFAQKLGYYLLNRLNNKSIDEKKAAEVELMLEAVLRRKLDSFIYELISKLGSIMPMGFGQNVYPALVDTIALNNEGIHDYFILATIRSGELQKDYLSRVISQINRNEIGLKVIVWNNKNGYFPSNQYSQALDEFKKRLSTYPIKEPIILRHQEVDYIAMGFDCKHLERSKLIGLYPIDLIEEHILLRRKELIMFCILSLIVTLMLSSIITKSFLSPLSDIYDGAKAIEEKNFQYKLPYLGRNEFGAMGNIFNEVIVDLEELSVAGAIQEQLLPNSEIKTGYFSLYGKSVAMGALGGDYFDFIEMEDNKFSVALGDVAGHGVGASLIMAMAKAGLVSLDSLWKSPQKLITKLHNMVYQSKTQNQRKIMTFQYIYLDGETGRGVYSNAGGCSPFIIRKSKGIVEELKLSGAVLGAFKKGKFNETEVGFEDGDAIVFYTDGVVECKDKSGNVLGYDNLKNLLQKCWDKNAKKFYNNVYNSYLEYIGGNKNDAEDDVTVVILVFNKNVEAYNQSENLDLSANVLEN